MLYSARARSSAASSPSRHLRARGHVLCHSPEAQLPALAKFRLSAQVGYDRECLPPTPQSRLPLRSGVLRPRSWSGRAGHLDPPLVTFSLPGKGHAPQPEHLSPGPAAQAPERRVSHLRAGCLRWLGRLIEAEASAWGTGVGYRRGRPLGLKNKLAVRWNPPASPDPQLSQPCTQPGADKRHAVRRHLRQGGGRGRLRGARSYSRSELS